MTDHVARVYVLAAAVLAFCLTWAVVAAHPWASPAPARDPRLAALAVREAHVRSEAARVQRLVAHRWAVYRHDLAARRRANAAATTAAAAVPSPTQPVSAPSVRVVTLPPLVVTRTS
jgi:hypothetical protein